MKKISYILVVMMLVAVSAPFVSAGNGNSNNGRHAKATGSVVWTARTNLPVNQQIPGLVSVFDAHDLGVGMVDRGTHTLARPADDYYGFGGGSITIDISCVHVDGDEAWFAGEAVEATGDYSANLGDIYLYWVKDGSTSGAESDKIGGRSYSTLSQACNVVDGTPWRGTGDVTSGNLRVHN